MQPRGFEPSTLVVVVVVAAAAAAAPPSPSRGVAEEAQLGAEAGGQGRHHAVVFDVGRLRVDGAQAPRATLALQR